MTALSEHRPSDAAASQPPGLSPGGQEIVHASSRQLQLCDLMAGAQELFILHNGRNYRLRLTRQGKLLLTA